MRIRSCFFLVLSLGWSHELASADVLWYGGDSTDGAIQNTRGPNFPFSVVDDFVVSGNPWHVTALFSNNAECQACAAPPGHTPFTEAIWSVRIGAGPNDMGQTLFGGVSPASAIPTGRFEGLEYQIMVSDLSFNLAPGTYFMQVSPVAPVPVYYVGISDGTNAIGTSGPSRVLIESFDTNPPTIGPVGGPGSASIGVIGNVVMTQPVPEPHTFWLLGIAGMLAASFLLVRQRR